MCERFKKNSVQFFLECFRNGTLFFLLALEENLLLQIFAFVE